MKLGHRLLESGKAEVRLWHRPEVTDFRIAALPPLAGLFVGWAVVGGGPVAWTLAGLTGGFVLWLVPGAFRAVAIRGAGEEARIERSILWVFERTWRVGEADRLVFQWRRTRVQGPGRAKDTFRHAVRAVLVVGEHRFPLLDAELARRGSERPKALTSWARMLQVALESRGLPVSESHQETVQRALPDGD